MVFVFFKNPNYFESLRKGLEIVDGSEGLTAFV